MFFQVVAVNNKNWTVYLSGRYPGEGQGQGPRDQGKGGLGESTGSKKSKDEGPKDEEARMRKWERKIGKLFAYLQKSQKQKPSRNGWNNIFKHQSVFTF